MGLILIFECSEFQVVAVALLMDIRGEWHKPKQIADTLRRKIVHFIPLHLFVGQGSRALAFWENCR